MFNDCCKNMCTGYYICLEEANQPTPVGGGVGGHLVANFHLFLIYFDIFSIIVGSGFLRIVCNRVSGTLTIVSYVIVRKAYREHL